MTKSKVFLGGTCNNSTWRDFLIPSIQVDYFNPVVKDWTPECKAIEDIEKKSKCDIHLYVITKEMTGTYSIAESVDSAYTKGKITIFHVIPDGFDIGQLKSLYAVVDIIKKAGGIAYVDTDLMRTARVINNCFKTI